LTDRHLSQLHEAWLDKRGIDPELAVAMGLYSARAAPRGEGETGFKEPDPSATGEILVWPYTEAGREVNAKFRAPGKRFYQRPTGRKTFWNSDVIDSPELLDSRAALVITEGETDAMIALQDGHPWTVSVPDGAPADKDQHGRLIPMKPDSEIDPENDAKFSYVVGNWDRLAKVKRFILATDGDGPGQRLRDELARRLGRVRCAFVEYPAEPCVPVDGKLRPCKDLNEVHVHHGPEVVRQVLQRAKPYPVAGLYTLDDYENRGDLVTFSTGFRELDPFIKLYRGAFIVISGLPTAGKSAWINQVAFNMAARYGWRIALATFEAGVKPIIRDQLTGFYTEKPKAAWTRQDREEADRFIREHFVFITDDPKGENDDEATVDWLVDRAADAVIRFGIDMLIGDPWNELSHPRSRGEMRDEYTGRAIRTIKRFAKRFDVCCAIVAHPTKDAAEAAAKGSMSLYDISDGAMWVNKAELGVIVNRHGKVNEVGRGNGTIAVRKVKFWETGSEGEAMIPWDQQTRMFLTSDRAVHRPRLQLVDPEDDI
jgi:twinkle protein